MFAVGFGANQFTPMLVVYKHELALSAGTQDALFGVYAIGLVPGLLLGGRASDRFGRRPLVLGFAALGLVMPARETLATRASGPLFAWPHAARTRAFGLRVAPIAPWVFGLVTVSCVILPQAIAKGRADAVIVAGVANALTLGCG